MRTTTIDVTPAGNGLFQVDLRDDAGESTHEVAVPDTFARRFEDDEEVALKDVVLAAVEWRLDHEGREDLPPSFSLADLEGDDAQQRIAEIARSRATGVSPATGEQRGERTSTDSDERLVEQVKQEQADGEVSSPKNGPRF